MFYGRANDPYLVHAKNMTHGIGTQPSFFAKDLCNPRPKSLFQQRMIDRKEGHYASHIVAPLGRSHNQAVGLPKGLNPVEFTFGIPTELGKYTLLLQYFDLTVHCITLSGLFPDQSIRCDAVRQV